MYKKSDFQIGDKLYEPCKSRHHYSYVIKEHTIKKIGNKYIETDCCMKIILKDLEIRDYTGRIGYAYKNEQEAKDFIEKENLDSKLFRFFDNHLKRCKLSLKQLREISKIIDEIKGE